MTEIDYRQIDWGIRGFVRELNTRGFRTIFSCAGHYDEDVGWGYVTIKGYSRKRRGKLCRIATKHVKSPRITEGRLGWNYDKIHRTMKVTDVRFTAKNLTKSPGWDGEI